MRAALLALVVSVVPAVAAAQGTPSQEVFAGYQQFPGEVRVMRGAAAGLVIHRPSRMSALITLSGFSQPDHETWPGQDTVWHRQTQRTAVHLGAGGRWQIRDGRLRVFAQAQGVLAYQRTTTTVMMDSPHADPVERHYDSGVTPLIQGGIGATVGAFRRVGLSGSFEVYRPLSSLEAEANHYRGSIGLTVRLGGD